MFPTTSKPYAARLAAAVLAAGLAVAVALAVAAPAEAKRKQLTGTFQIAPGKSVKQKNGRVKVSGSYFRMVYPGGNQRRGPFFNNPNSASLDKTYTLFRRGIDKGLRTGSFQPQPNPAFADNGFALANRIVRPLPFAGIRFSLSTSTPDAQGGTRVGVPRIWVDGRKLGGDLRAFTASWNKIYFNQGSPKPNGRYVGATRPVRGTYDPKTRRYSISWVSQIVGGPFNDFAGYWRFEGRFVPGKAR